MISQTLRRVGREAIILFIELTAQWLKKDGFRKAKQRKGGVDNKLT